MPGIVTAGECEVKAYVCNSIIYAESRLQILLGTFADDFYLVDGTEVERWIHIVLSCTYCTVWYV